MIVRHSALICMTFLAAAPLAAQAQETTGGPEVARIDIQPAEVSARVGDTVRMSATAFDAEGRELDVPVQWFTSYEIGTIDSTGAFVAASPGSRTIIATAGPANTSVRAVVQPLPVARLEPRLPATTVTATSWLPLAALAYDRNGARVFEPAIAWTSSDPGIAEVVGVYLVAHRAGTITLTATADDGTATETVVVGPAPSGALAVQAPEGALQTGDVHRLQPTLGGSPLGTGAFPRYTINGPGGRVFHDGAFVAEAPGEYVVVAEYAGSSAVAPIRVAEREHDRKLELVGHSGPEAHTADLWVADDVAYLGTFGDNWLRVYDVSDPSNPILTDSISVDARRINDVMMNPEQGFAIMTREGAANRVNGIVILDTTDPLHPTIAGEYTETVPGGVHTTWIVDELVYATHNGTGDMRIIDVSDRANPKEVGRWGLDKQNRVLHDIFIKDGIAYLSHWDDGLVILDLGGAGKGGTPTAPVFVSRIHYPEGNTHTAWRWNDYVFVGDEIFPEQWDMDRPIDARGYIHVIDVSDLENPVEVAKYEVPEAGAHNIWIEDDEETLYIAYYQAGLRALDVSGELRGDLFQQGREVDRYLTQSSEGVALPNAPFAATVIKVGDLLYTVDLNSGLWVHRMVPTGDRPIS